jgi:3-(3-hydroxy-phenyl)propionate hydroxylase
VEADYLLGCDGSNSLVRSRIGATMRDLRFDQRWLVIDVATTADLGQWEGVHQVCNPNRAGTFMQIGDIRYRWEFRLLPGETADDFATLSALRPLIAPWISQIGDERLELIRVAEYTFRARIAETWRRGNTFLLGDAAHLTPPFIGQGMGAGLRDAMNLSWKLAGVLDGSLPPEALGTYEQERKPHARKMIRLALTVGRAMTAGGRAGDLLRRAVVPKLHALPGMRVKVVDSTTPPLGRSRLVHKTPTGNRLAGTLCPNVMTADGRRLDTVLGDGFALVTAQTPEVADRLLAERLGARVYAAEPGGELAGWLRRGRAEAAIIRPDRVVLRAGRDVSALCQALRSPAR